MREEKTIPFEKKYQKIFQNKKSDSSMETIITGEGKTTRQNQKRSFVVLS